MKLEDINKKLEEISHSLDNIDYTKELKDADAKKVMDKVNGIDNLVAQDNFGKDELDEAVKTLDELNQKALDGVTKMDKFKESTESINNKTDISDTIKSKYDNLFKQKEVIDKYVKDYDPQNIIDIKEDKIKSNNKEIKQKVKLKNKIEKFKRQPEVKDRIDKIESLNLTNKVIEAASKRVKEIQNLEKRKSAIKNPAIQADYDKKIKEEKDKLKGLLDGTKIKYNDNMSNLETTLKDTLTANKKDIIKEAVELDKLVKDKDLKKALGSFTLARDPGPSEVREILDNAYHKINGEILGLNKNNKELESDINLMRDDLTKENVDYINMPSNYPPTSYVPTDAEIESDPDYSAALVPMSRKDKIKSRKDFLRDKAGIDKDDKKWHPLIWAKSHIAGKSVDKQMMNDVKENIKSKLIAARQKQENDEYDAKACASERKDNARTRFVDELTRTVLTNKGINMDTAASKAYGKAEQQKYDEGR